MAVFENFPYTDVHQLNLDWIISKVREYLTKVDALEIDFNTLKNYVVSYFDNLDIQEEVNNKLDEMASSGQLAEIIAQYLDTLTLIAFNTKKDMKSANNLVNGVDILTLGTETYNDGKTALYKVRELTSSDIIDDITIVALTNFPTLIAEKLTNSTITDLYNQIEKVNNLIPIHTITRNTDKNTATDFFIDNVNGDDTNDGYTSTTAFKTLQPIIDMLNKGKSFLFITFVSGGTYYWGNYHNLWNVVLHFSRLSSNINPIIHYEADMVCYDSRINCDGITFEFDDNETMKMYGDNTFFTMNNCVFKGTLAGYGGSSLDATSNEFYSLSFTQSHIRINGIIINSNKDTPLVFNYGCYVLIAGAFKYKGTNNGVNNSSLIYLSSSDISIIISEPDITELIGKPMYGLRLYQSKGITNNTRLNSLAAIGTKGNSIPSPNLVVTSASVI